MSKGKKDLMAGCVLVVFSAVYFALSFQIKLTSIDRIVGSRMFPQILGVCMFLLGICLIVGGIAAMKRERKASATQAEHQEATENVDSRVAAMMKNAEEAGEEALKAKDTKKVIWKTIGVFGSFALYIVLLDKIGFTIASILYLFSQMIMMAKPFVLFVSFCTPHFPLIAPQEFVDMYPDPEKLPRPVQFDPGEWPHHPLIDDYRRYCGTDQVDEAAALNGRRIYYALCSFMDAQVGKVMTALRESGLAEETRVLYCADHGDTMGAHGVYYKSTMYEGSVGIPMLLAGPDIPVGATVSTNVSLLDVFPTVLDCVGARPSDKDRCLPGRSLIDIAINAPDEDRAVCAEYYSQGIYTAMFMLRNRKYKYVHYVHERPQLFDMENDPDECCDLAADPAYAEVVASMHAQLETVFDTEALESASKQAQAELMDAHGGEEEFLRTFKPMLFSPIPKIE